MHATVGCDQPLACNMVADNGGLQAVAAGTENAYKHEKTCVVAVVFLFRELCKSEEIPYDISPLQPQCVKRSCSGMPRWLLQPKLLGNYVDLCRRALVSCRGGR